MRPILTDTPDRTAITTTAIVERLHELDREGVRVVAVRSVFERLNRPGNFNAALKRAQDEGLLRMRRLRTPNGRRRRFVALARNAHRLSGGA